MKKINIAKLLEDCPKGMELDCTMFENVTFEKIDGNNIVISRKSVDSKVYLTQYGELNSIDGKCVIFPKGKTTWEGFVPHCQFKNGDIITDNENGPICIYKNEGILGGTVDYHCGVLSSGDFKVKNEKKPERHFGYIKNYRFATEEEKQKLFDAIKANGYKWNAETKTLEKLIEPYFKVGDRIKHKTDKWQAKRTIQTYVSGIGYITTIKDWILLENQDCWELVPNKFDITTLKPFDKVLVRTNVHNPVWSIDFYGGYDIKIGGSFTPFAVTSGKYFQQCIPYKGNEHLRGTTNDCDDFYKIW